MKIDPLFVIVGTPQRVTGSARYGVSELGNFQWIEGDFSVSGGDPQHFRSDFTPGGNQFPRIAVQASINNLVCYDTVLTIVALPVACLADLDQDGTVNLPDLAELLAQFGWAAADGDIDGDGDVDLNDLIELLAQFGQSCPR